MELTIRHRPESGRFETEVDGHLAVLSYRRQQGRILVDHVGVPAAVEGRGIAGQLTRHALDWARESDLRVTPICPYVVAWIRRHPAYSDLVLD